MPSNARYIDIDNLTLENVIDDEMGRSLLTQFMASGHNSEPMLFIGMVEEYVTFRSSCNRYESAKTICDQFIVANACHELNISQQTRINTLNKFQEECSLHKCSRDLFDECVVNVMLEMKEDVWPRFLNSTECKQLIGDVAFEQILKRQQSPRQQDSTKPQQSGLPSQQQLQPQQTKQAFSFVTTPTELSITESSVNKKSPRNNKEAGITSPSPPIRPYVTEDDTAMLRRFCLPPTPQIEEALWSEMSQKQGYSLHSTKVPVKMNGKSTKMWRLTGVVDAPVEMLVNAAIATEHRKKYDGCLTSAEYLGYRSAKDIECKFSSSIMYERYSFPIVSDREAVYACTMKYETYSDRYWKRYIVAKKSIPYEQLLTPKNTIRVEGISLHIFEQANTENTQSRYYVCEWIDMRGSMMSWMWNKVVKVRAAKFHEGIQESVRVYRDNNPSANKELHNERLMDTLRDYLKNNIPRHCV